jgi:hypothetical protein
LARDSFDFANVLFAKDKKYKVMKMSALKYIKMSRKQ